MQFSVRRALRALTITMVVVAIVQVIQARRRAAGSHAEGTRGAPMRPLRGFVMRWFNPTVIHYGLAGGARSPWGLVEHVGRKSGRVYRTPVSPRPVEGGFEFPLPYGADVHWVRNVLAAGRARIQFHDTISEVDRPEIVTADSAVSIPLAAQPTAERLGYRYLRVRTVASMVGTFSHAEGHPAAFTHGAATPMVSEGPFAEFLPPADAAAEVPAEPRFVETDVAERDVAEREAVPAG